ncbi:molybdenum cofactor biosynthesis protein B [Salinivibrio sp. ML290]|uniref:molybdenum cofactor biosynthesis protein B n=1 Tax=Salinivibrio sp. ML290 TaxID=1909468 RepID=UPI0009887A40|nr:molybdenum cofactor biosynthesis protein B [Salinivibrio sp. ML290]OOE72286.1 molybdenum cofactor biosynthesis protein B [Salinivibrio sp. ML290]
MADHTSYFIALNVAVLTVSDTRNSTNDTSGNFLSLSVKEAGHSVSEHLIVRDDIYDIRAVVSRWIADDSISAIIITGGTGFSERDSTPEAIKPLFDKDVEGFGEIFRLVSYQEIGTSTIQSRCVAGVANRTIIFALPGSTGACKTGWNMLIKEQLDAEHGPCNFVPHIANASNCASRG